MEVDDTVLVERAQGGDVDAIGELYDAHHQPIFRYVWSRVGDQQLAEDFYPHGNGFIELPARRRPFPGLALPHRSQLNCRSSSFAKGPGIHVFGYG